ncbi:fungal-specific transcription factor domain-containing protein, partial [Pyrenochaeta sp. MPI-SDFR-AT-0127]
RSSSTAFSGETSLDHTLSQVEDQLGAVGVDCSDRAPAGDGNLPSPVHSTLAFPVSDSDPTGLLRRALLSNEISLDRVRWDLRLQNFFDEIYILYPMLFIPDVKAIYNRLWDDWFLLPVEQDQQVALRYRMQVAQILLCLAAGACTVSRRASTENGKHAAGWSLYCTAMDVIGDLFALIESDSPMEALQTLVLIVVYLLPLDGIERGQKVLSIAISYAHQVGIHRQKMLNRMSFFDDEMYRRIWWCIYIMDRRYALETGRPFLTQDFNIDTAMPRNCSDEWLATHHKNPQTSLELAGSLDAHLLEDHSTPVPYLCTMAQYCRILGKVWEIMYGADNIDALPGRFQIEYLETLLSKYEAEIPFKYQESSEHRDSDAEWRHVKQRALTRMRISGLRLLIRQPLLRKPPSGPTEVQNYIGNEVMCLQFAHDIIERHLQIPDKHPKFLYPFIHYLANAATISLVILIKEPLFRPTYGAATILAVRTLRSYCTKTWVSGKLIRSVMRLNQMIAMVL